MEKGGQTMIDADLISRKAAVSRISDLIVLELRCERIPTWNEVYKALNDLPTLDAVPVVRCKDCMYCGAVQCALATEYNQYRPDVDPDWFCAKGRRAKHETP